MSNWTYILVMGATTYLLRVLPMLFIRKPIENTFIRSFLYYVPYITLAVMTFPAITTASGNVIAGWAAFLIGMFLAWKDKSMIQVALVCCILVYILQMIV